MSDLLKTVVKADVLYERQNFDGCIETLKEAHNLRYSEKDDFAENLGKLQALKILAQSYMHKGKLETAIMYLEKVNDVVPIGKMIKDVSKQSSHNRKELFIQIHNMYTAYGETLLKYFDQMYSSADKQKQEQCIKKSREKYVLAHKTTKQRLLYEQRNSNTLDKEWLEKYTDDLINILNVTATEGQTFVDDRCYEQCFKIIKKLEKFYEVHKKQNVSYKNLYKSYYIKGAILRRMSRYEEAKVYLLKDENFCKKQNYKDLLITNWIELRSIYITLGDYTSALERVQNSQEKSMIKQFRREEQNLRSLVKKLSQAATFNSSEFDMFIDLIDAVQRLYSDKSFYKQLLNLSEVILNKHTSLTMQHRFEIVFTKAESYYKLKKYQEAKQILDKLSIQIPNQEEELRIRILKDAIYTKINPKQIKMIEQFYNKTLDFARKLNNSSQIQNIKNNFKEAKEKYERLKIDPSFQLSDDEEYVIRPFVEEKEEKKELTKKINLSNPKQVIAKEESNIYNKLCLEQQVQINKLLREEMKDKKGEVLKQFISLEPSHILILLEALKNLKSLDLQLHKVDEQFWKVLISLVEQKRVNVDKLEELVVCTQIQNEKLIHKFLEFTQNLRILKISHIFIKNIPQISYQNIQILLLNSVNLTDISVSNIPFQNMNNLEEVILENNQLTASCFSQLNKIYKRIHKLNLSRNPLKNTRTENIDKLEVIVDKIVMKDIQFTQTLSKLLLRTLSKSSIISLSRSYRLKNLLKEINDRYEEEREDFPIRQLKLNEISEDQSFFEQLYSLFVLCSSTLKTIRMKFIKEKADTLTGFLQLINQKYPTNTLLDYRGSDFEQIHECKINLIS